MTHKDIIEQLEEYNFEFYGENSIWIFEHTSLLWKKVNCTENMISLAFHSGERYISNNTNYILIFGGISSEKFLNDSVKI